MIHTDDVSAWKTTLDLVVLVGMLALYAFTYWNLAARKVKSKKVYVIVTICFVVFLIGHTLNSFVFFNSGKIADIPEVSADGHVKIVQEAPDLTPEDQLAANAEAKKDKYLKAQDTGPKEAREESDAYLKTLLERNK